MSDIGEGNQFVVPGGANGFCVQFFVNWLKKLFYIGEHSDLNSNQNLNKMFKWEGVVIMTDGVKASLHYCISDTDDNNDVDEQSVKPLPIIVDENGEYFILQIIPSTK